jgi:hypothetical protein
MLALGLDARLLHNTPHDPLLLIFLDLYILNGHPNRPLVSSSSSSSSPFPPTLPLHSVPPLSFPFPFPFLFPFPLAAQQTLRIDKQHAALADPRVPEYVLPQWRTPSSSLDSFPFVVQRLARQRVRVGPLARARVRMGVGAGVVGAAAVMVGWGRTGGEQVDDGALRWLDR